MTDSELAVETEVINVKVANIRPKYNNLKEWTEDINNIYIGRKGVVFVKNYEKNERYPKKDSIWANPFKVGKIYNREQCIQKYKEYIIEKIKNDPNKYNLEELKGKRLGCWCKPESCHGDVLVELLMNRDDI